MLVVLVLAVAIQRFLELQIASSNVAHLERRGAVEVGAGHYPLMVLLHGGWLFCMLWEWMHGGLWLNPTVQSIGWGCLLIGQALRWWTIRTLGRRWTTRVLILPGVPLVKAGPFRYLSHPNYLGVVLEIFGLPLIGGCWRSSLLFGVLNLLLLRKRMQIENEALANGVSGAGWRSCE